jgi:alkylated DNA repair dioxygenase AlkB
VPPLSNEVMWGFISLLLSTLSGLIVWYGRELLLRVKAIETAIGGVVTAQAVQANEQKAQAAALARLEKRDDEQERKITETGRELAVAMSGRSRR